MSIYPISICECNYHQVTVYADAPRYGAGRHFKFTDETIAHTFAHIVNIRLKEIK